MAEVQIFGLTVGTETSRFFPNVTINTTLTSYNDMTSFTRTRTIQLLFYIIFTEEYLNCKYTDLSVKTNERGGLIFKIV